MSVRRLRHLLEHVKAPGVTRVKVNRWGDDREDRVSEAEIRRACPHAVVVYGERADPVVEIDKEFKWPLM